MCRNSQLDYFRPAHVVLPPTESFVHDFVGRIIFATSWPIELCAAYANCASLSQRNIRV